MSDFNPERLQVVGATELERRLLAAAARERPSVELTRRMARGAGVATSAALAALGSPAAAATPAGAGLSWALVSAAVAVLAVAGAIVGWSRAHRPQPAAPAPVIRVAPTIAPSPPQPAALAPEPAPRLARRSRSPGEIAAAPAPATDLRGEIALLDAARAAAADGAAARVLACLRRYDATYPHGTFRPESAALQIEALAQLGQTARAWAWGQAFLAAHPDSPLVARVQRAINHLEGFHGPRAPAVP